MECEPEENIFYLYHSFGHESLEELRKNGLMSFSCIGRSKVGRNGDIIALTRDRIWFSREIGCEFSKIGEQVFLRVKFDKDDFENDFGEIHDDDQFADPSGCTVFVEKNGEFRIPPWDIDYRDGERWIPVSDYISYWKPASRSLEERMQPGIRHEFKMFGLSPSSDFDIKAYVYVENTEGIYDMIKEEYISKKEFWSLVNEYGDNIFEMVFFDHEIC